MPAQNIDKKKFGRNCDKWVRETEPQVVEWLFTKYLYKDLITLISNTTYYWDFTDPRLTYEDVEADLLMHLIIKREKLRAYSGNWYNIVFTMFKRKLFDILRSHRDEDANLGKMYEFCTHIKNSIEENNTILEYELEQPEQRPDVERPADLNADIVQPDPVEEEVRNANRMQTLRAGKKPKTGGTKTFNTSRYGLQLSFGFYEFTGQ